MRNSLKKRQKSCLFHFKLPSEANQLRLVRTVHDAFMVLVITMVATVTPTWSHYYDHRCPYISLYMPSFVLPKYSVNTVKSTILQCCWLQNTVCFTVYEFSFYKKYYIFLYLRFVEANRIEFSSIHRNQRMWFTLTVKIAFNVSISIHVRDATRSNGKFSVPFCTQNNTWFCFFQKWIFLPVAVV